MNNIEIVKMVNNTAVMDSRDVADMIGKRHDHLVRDIDYYANIISQSNTPNLGASNFFIESTYKQAGNGKVVKCYKLTKQGCEMVANKMTGKNGILFTATYVKAFNAMEQQQNKPMTLTEIVASSANILVQQEQAISELKSSVSAQNEKLDKLQASQIINDNWRAETTRIINEIVNNSYSYTYESLRKEIYDAVNSRIHVNVYTRQKNIKKNLAKAGASKTKIKQVSVLDAIENDEKIIECYKNICKEYATKYL